MIRIFRRSLAVAAVSLAGMAGLGTGQDARATAFNCTFEDAADRYCESAFNATFVDVVTFVGGTDVGTGQFISPQIPFSFDNTDSIPQMFEQPGGPLTAGEASNFALGFGQRRSYAGGITNNGSDRMGYVFNGDPVALEELTIMSLFGFAVDELRIDGWLGGLQVASTNLIFGTGGLAKGVAHTISFGSAFASIDQLLFTPMFNNTENFGAFWFDNMSVAETSEVGEPSTLAAFGLALAGIGFATRRRRRR